MKNNKKVEKFLKLVDILEKLKPLETKYNVIVILSDEIKYIPLSSENSLLCTALS